MIIPDFRQLKMQRHQAVLAHSAKGSEWDKHKYVKKIDGVYYYPVGYEDGRTVDELSGSKDEKKDSGSSNKETIDQVKNHFDEYLKKRGIDWTKLPKAEVDEMQRDIIRQLVNRRAEVFSLENLISCSVKTHKMIHYGSKLDVSRSKYVERSKNDTCPWRR